MPIRILPLRPPADPLGTPQRIINTQPLRILPARPPNIPGGAFRYYYLRDNNTVIGTNDRDECVTNLRDPFLLNTPLTGYPEPGRVETLFAYTPVGFTPLGDPFLFITNVFIGAMIVSLKASTYSSAITQHRALYDRFNKADELSTVKHHVPVAAPQDNAIFIDQTKAVKEYEFVSALTLKFGPRLSDHENILNAAIGTGGVAIYPFYANVAFGGESFWVQIMGKGQQPASYLGRVANRMKLTATHGINFNDYVHIYLHNIIQLR